MDRPFDRPITLSNGREIVVIETVTQAGLFLLNGWPQRRGRRRKAYRTAVNACAKAMGGRVEAEAARQAFLAALVDLWGKNSPVERRAQNRSLCSAIMLLVLQQGA